MATITNSVTLATILEPIAVNHGYHVGIGGGTINKEGDRKDIDVIIYRRRDKKQSGACSPLTVLFGAFVSADVVYSDLFSDFLESKERWCTKATWRGIAVDFLFPESLAGEYQASE